MTAYLVVVAGGSRVGLRLADVLEVLEAPELVRVPGAHPSVRGVSPVHGRLLPRVDLAALLAGRSAPGGAEGAAGGEDAGVGGATPTIVVVCVAGRMVAFEVDDVDLATQDDVLPLPDAWEGPSAVGAARHGDELVPLLEVGGLLARLDTLPGSR